jgi:hypothetical protein
LCFLHECADHDDPAADCRDIKRAGNSIAAAKSSTHPVRCANTVVQRGTPWIENAALVFDSCYALRNLAQNERLT